MSFILRSEYKEEENAEGGRTGGRLFASYHVVAVNVSHGEAPRSCTIKKVQVCTHVYGACACRVLTLQSNSASHSAAHLRLVGDGISGRQLPATLGLAALKPAALLPAMLTALHVQSRRRPGRQE